MFQSGAGFLVWYKVCVSRVGGVLYINLRLKVEVLFGVNLQPRYIFGILTSFVIIIVEWTRVFVSRSIMLVLFRNIPWCDVAWITVKMFLYKKKVWGVYTNFWRIY